MQKLQVLAARINKPNSFKTKGDHENDNTNLQKFIRNPQEIRFCQCFQKNNYSKARMTIFIKPVQ